MLTVDTHAHAGTSWFEPIESLVFQMDRNEVDKAVLIQHRGVYDNTYLFDCVGRYPGRFTVAAMVDTARDDASSGAWWAWTAPRRRPRSRVFYPTRA